jgi:RAB6A-GEF complex partner protein 1
LVDGKLVLLQPSRTEEGALKYDMRVIAHNVEFYILMRDQLSFTFGHSPGNSNPPSPSAESVLNSLQSDQSLRDSLWVFNGQDLVMWNDVQDVLRASSDVASLPIFVDFYPLSILLNRGVILGIESEMIQKRDVTFALFRFAIRVRILLTLSNHPVTNRQ